MSDERKFESLTLDDVMVHRPPLLLLARLCSYTPAYLEAEACVEATHPFATVHGVPALLAIEYLAQAVAAHQGVMDCLAGRPVCEGFLLGARAIRLHVDQLALGTRLHARVEREFALGDAFGRYVCRLTNADTAECVAEGDLKVFQSPEHVRVLKLQRRSEGEGE